jgi:hypothetical protein
MGHHLQSLTLKIQQLWLREVLRKCHGASNFGGMCYEVLRASPRRFLAAKP